MLTGNGSSVPYACQIFDEPEVNNTTASAVYHNAAAVYAATSAKQTLYAYYSNAAAPGPLYATGLGYTPIVLGTAATLGGAATLFDGLDLNYPPMGWTNPNGAAFEINTSPTQMTAQNAPQLATVFPSSVDPADTNNYMPNAVSQSQQYSGLDANMAIFVVDNASGGLTLLGTFTP